MQTDLTTSKEQALAAATSWWTGRPFPYMWQDGPYPCSECGRPIMRREGTSLMGAVMRCPECTDRYFEGAASGPPAPTPLASPPPGPAAPAESSTAAAATADEATAAATREPPGSLATAAGAAPPAYPPPSLAPPPRPRRRPSRMWIIIGAVVVVVALVTTGLLLWAPWKPAAPPIGPGNVHVVATAPDSVTLAWSAPAGQPAPSKYEVVNGDTYDTVGSVPGSTTSYQVTGLEPATKYTYEVIAFWGDKESEFSDAVTATTTAPAVADARLTGDMPVQLTVTTASAGLNVGDTWNDTYTFTPACASGACATTLDGGVTPPGYNSHTFSVRLDRNGAGYSGSGTAHITHCGPPGSEIDVNDTVKVVLTVTSGAVSEGTWTASAWNGTVEVDAPYTEVGNYYCPAQTIATSASSTR